MMPERDILVCYINSELLSPNIVINEEVITRFQQ